MIVSCGEALVDCFQSANSNSFDTIIGGSPLNVAVALRKAGTDVALLSNISTDQFGEMLMHHLQTHKVSTHLISRSSHLSGLMLVEYKADKSAIYNYYGHNTAETNFDYNTLDMAELQPADCLHFGSFSLVSGLTGASFAFIIEQQHIQRIISIDINVRIAVEPSLELWRNKLETLVRQAHIFKASAEDVALLYNIEQFDQTDAEKLMNTWLAAGVNISVITDAEKGVYALFKGQLIHVPAISVDVVDTVGAGDCFMAFFLNYLESFGLLKIKKIQNISLEQLENAIAAGIKAASFTVSQKGAVFPYITNDS